MIEYQYGIFVKEDGKEIWLENAISIPSAEASVNIWKYSDYLDTGEYRTYVIRPRKKTIDITYGDWEEPV